MNKTKAVLIVGALVFTVLHLCCKMVVNQDDLDNYNIVYTYLQSGQMSFPLYGFYDSEPNHPPYYYYLVAWLIKGGLNTYFAVVLPHLLLHYFILFLLWKIKAGFEATLAFVLALLVPFTGDISLQLRPDHFLFLLLFAGLLLLEYTRADTRKPVGWYAGVGLVSVASLIHPYGCFAFLAVPVYRLSQYYTARKQGRYISTARLFFTLLIPAVIIGLHLLLYIYPNLGVFKQVVGAKAFPFSVVESVRAHYAMVVESYHVYPLLAVFSVGLPAWLCTIAIAFYLKQFRTFSLALLPMYLFLFFFTVRPLTGYYYPELAYQVFALVLLGFAVYKKAVEVFGQKILRLVFLSLLGITLYATASSIVTTRLTWYPVNFWKHGSEIDLIRSCAQQITGTHAHIAGSRCMWYISGARQWHSIEDSSWGRIRTDTALRDSLASFDYLTQVSLGQNHGHTFLDLYLDSVTEVKGFLLNDYNRSVTSPQETNFVLHRFADTADTQALKGFYCDRYHRLFQFEPCGADTAAQFFCSYKLNPGLRYEPYIEQAIAAMAAPLYLPDSTGHGFPGFVIYGVYNKAQIRALDLLNTQAFTLRDYVPLAMQEISIDEMIEAGKKYRQVELTSR